MTPVPKQQISLFSPQAPTRGLEFLVPWQPFWPTFLENLRDTVLRREPPPLVVTSHPAPFWGDVFVNRPMPWKNFAQSGTIHAGLVLLIYTTGHLWFARQPTLQDQYTHTTITYYELSPELPAVTTPAPKVRPKQAMKGEPELAKQEIISVPVGADNSTQTIVTQIYNSAFKDFDMGVASAQALVLFLLIATVAVFQFRIFRSDVEY